MESYTMELRAGKGDIRPERETPSFLVVRRSMKAAVFVGAI